MVINLNLKFLGKHRYSRICLGYALIALLIFTGCESKKSFFSHEIKEGNKPWNKETFDNTPDKFSFIVHSDLTGGERPRIYEVAVAQMNLLRPEFILNVGDLIEGGDADSSLWNSQWESFNERADRAIAPVFYTGGNHDLTGNFAQGIWKLRRGRNYYHFLYENTLFLVLDSEDHGPERNDEIEQIRNEGIRILDEQGASAYAKSAYANLPERKWGNISQEQQDYFLEVIREYPDVKWTFLLVHKPLWENPDQIRFAALEKELAGRNYTVFNGHTHTYRYMQRNGMDYINLATTGGSQNPTFGRAMDHLIWVTVDNSGVSIAPLLMEGILDKTGHIPVGGDTLVFEKK